MEETMTVQLQTLTPLWTGGAGGTCDRLHETGIIGSLRWWYETIVRGLGGYACDPSEYNAADEERCEVSKVYGKNGYRRRFRLDLRPAIPDHTFAGDRFLIPSGRVHERNGRNAPGGWFIGNGYWDKVEARIFRLSSTTDDSAWALPFRLIHYWGALGAKTRNGFGVIRVENVEGLSLVIPALEGHNSKPGPLPDLRQMFFAKLGFETTRSDWWREAELLQLAWRGGVITDGTRSARLRNVREELSGVARVGTVPLAPAFKNWLRYGRIVVLRAADREIFGQVRTNNNWAGRIHISSAYRVGKRWEIRVWGWLPASEHYDRDQVLQSLHLALHGNPAPPWAPLLGNAITNPKLLVWREFASQRDSVARITVPADFLISLAKGEGA